MVCVSFVEPEVYVETTSAGFIHRGYGRPSRNGAVAGGSFAVLPETVVARPWAAPLARKSGQINDAGRFM
jgi:hypothetical protein